MIGIIAIVLIVSGIISAVWVNGIDYMKKNHPDYKGDDFLANVNKHAGRDSWDDNLYDEIY